jgi:hypothetical protein
MSSGIFNLKSVLDKSIISLAEIAASLIEDPSDAIILLLSFNSMKQPDLVATYPLM